MLTDHVVGYLGRVRLYDAGQGDPVITDHGLDWYDIAAYSWPAGSPNRDSRGRALLEYLDGVGIVCRPALNLQDTRKAQFTFHATADWSEIKPATGKQKYRLWQSNSTANLVWWAKSTYDLPQNPHVAFSLIFLDTPSDHDQDLLPPFVRIELGGDQPAWALEFSKTDGAALLRWVDGAWAEAARLNQQSLSYSDAEEQVVYLRVLRGTIQISMDRGETYTPFAFADGTPATIPAGKFTVRGTGGMFGFGLHQLAYATGKWTSPTRNMFTTRLLPPTAVFTPRTYQPVGTTIAFTDLSSHTAGLAQYQITLTPAKRTGIPFEFHSTPEYYSVLLHYPVVRTVHTAAYTEPWDGSLREIRISKPEDLDGGELSWTVRGDYQAQFVYGGRWRKVAIVLAELYDDGTTSDAAFFVGYVELPSAEQMEYGEKPLQFKAVNATVRARRMKWDDLTGIPPLGGQTVNQALDACLDRMGLTVDYRVWHVLGDAVLLPEGLAEDPFLWPKAGEPIFKTMTDIAGYAGLELFTDDIGVWHTLPKNYVNPFVTKQWDLSPASDLKELVLSVRFSSNASDNVTATLVKGQDLYGRAVYGYAIDAPAEADAASPRFSPWRETECEEIPFPITPAMAAGRAEFLALDQTVPKFLADVEGISDLTLSRRDRVQVLNSQVGIVNTDQFGVLSLEHTWCAIDRIGDVKTTAVLRRLGG